MPPSSSTREHSGLRSRIASAITGPRSAAPCYYSARGAGLTIGLHPASSAHAESGTSGGVGYGLEIYEPAERVMARLQEQGTPITSEIIRYEGGNCFMLLAPACGSTGRRWDCHAPTATAITSRPSRQAILC